MLEVNKKKFKIPNNFSATSQQFLINFHKAILKCFSDPIEKIRETSIEIMKEFTHLNKLFSFIFNSIDTVKSDYSFAK